MVPVVFLGEKVLWCDITVKVVLSVLCLKLFVNAFAFLLQSKKFFQKTLSNEAESFRRIFFTISCVQTRIKWIFRTSLPNLFLWNQICSLSHFNITLKKEQVAISDSNLTWTLTDGFSLTQSRSHFIVNGNEGITALQEKLLSAGLQWEASS